jgi:hypothetical protein
VTVLPPVPAFYHWPKAIEDLSPRRGQDPRPVWGRACPVSPLGWDVNGDRAALTVLGHLLRAGVAAASYGGPVITYANSRTSNVKALAFVASLGLDKGDTTRQRST